MNRTSARLTGAWEHGSTGERCHSICGMPRRLARRYGGELPVGGDLTQELGIV